MRLGPLTAAILVATCVAQRASASESCTIAYRVNATLEVTDTQLGKGDQTIGNLPGSLVVEYRQKQGAVVDGKAKILHYSMYERFKLESLVDVTTTIHHYAPRCRGVDEPTWRLPSDPGFPKQCRYAGSNRAAAIGELNRAAGKIEWAKCKAAPSYWAKDRKAYTPANKSKGRGCLSDTWWATSIVTEGSPASGAAFHRATTRSSLSGPSR